MPQVKVELKIGPFDEQGTFLGEVIRFTAEKLGTYEEKLGQTSSSDDRGTDYTLYELPDGTYRVFVENWSRWQGEGSYNHLYPNSAEYDPDDAPDLDPYDEEYGRPIVYKSYTEEEARKRYGKIFAAIGQPNVRDLDD